MDQSAGYMEDQEAPQPSQQQNYKQDDEHIKPPCSLRLTDLSGSRIPDLINRSRPFR
jgi:hypothetical protein